MSRVYVSDIQRAVCDHYRISREDMLSERRFKMIAEPRQVGMYLARAITPLSFPQIASRFNRRDHTTAVHAYRKIAANWHRFGRDVEAIRERLSA